MLHTPNHTMITVSDTKKYFAGLSVLVLVAIGVLVYLYTKIQDTVPSISRSDAETQAAITASTQALEATNRKQKDDLADPVTNKAVKASLSALEKSMKKENSPSEVEIQNTVKILGGK